MIGGGIAGLAAAYYLRHSPGSGSPHVTILESAPVVGGKLRLGEVGGVGIDVGAEALLARRPEALDLIEAVGLGHEVVHPDITSAADWSRGELHPLPAEQILAVPTGVPAGGRQCPLARRLRSRRVCLRRHAFRST